MRLYRLVSLVFIVTVVCAQQSPLHKNVDNDIYAGDLDLEDLMTNCPPEEYCVSIPDIFQFYEIITEHKKKQKFPCYEK